MRPIRPPRGTPTITSPTPPAGPRVPNAAAQRQERARTGGRHRSGVATNRITMGRMGRTGNAVGVRGALLARTMRRLTQAHQQCHQLLPVLNIVMGEKTKMPKVLCPSYGNIKQKLLNRAALVS